MRVIIKNCLNCRKPHEWEFTRPTLREMRYMDRAYGITAEQFEDGMNADNLSHLALEATAAFLDIMHSREGTKIPMLEIDVDMDDFEFVPDEAEVAAMAVAAQEAMTGGKDDEPTPG